MFILNLDLNIHNIFSPNNFVSYNLIYCKTYVIWYALKYVTDVKAANLLI